VIAGQTETTLAAQIQKIREKSWSNNRTKLDGLDSWRAFAFAHGKTFSFPEWSVSTRTDGHGGLDNSYYIQQMHDYIYDRGNHVSWYSLFDSDNVAGNIQSQLSPSQTNYPLAAAKYLEQFVEPMNDYRSKLLGN
jgi:hypothetical protein